MKVFIVKQLYEMVLLNMFCLSRRAAFLVLPQYTKAIALSFCTSSRRPAKIFVDNENKFAHIVLETSAKKYNIFRVESEHMESVPDKMPSLVLDNLSTAGVSVDDVFNSFCALIKLCVSSSSDVCISDARYKSFTDLFCRLSPQLSDEQLLESLRYLAFLPTPESPKSPNYVEIWNTLDIVCTRRIERWSIDQLLMYCDAWYILNLGRICDFVWEALHRLGRKIRRMPPEQLVHTMFFCNVVRKPILAMFEFEVNLLSCIDSLSLREIGVMAMGFFKTQTSIRNGELVEKIYQRLMDEIDTVEDITLVSLLKVLRYSTKLPQAHLVPKLLDRLCPQLQRLSLLSCLHVALLGSDIQYCHEQCLEIILQRFNKDLKQVRLKDMERISLVLSVCNFESTSGIERILSTNILKELPHKIDEIAKHPRCFANCLHFLSIKDYYDTEMISSVLEKRFLHHAYGKSKTLGREIFHLDSFVKINLKDANYTGHQLTERHRQIMGKMLTQYIPQPNSKYKLSFTDRILLEMKEVADRIFQTTEFKHILPHFQRPDIVTCYDSKAKKGVELSPECPEDYCGTILTRKELLGDKECEDIDSIVIVAAGWNNLVRGQNRYTGLFELKLKQLKMLNHKPIVIYWDDWRSLETANDREHFLKRKLATVTHL